MPTFEHIFEVNIRATCAAGHIRNIYHLVPVEPVLNGNDAAEALAFEMIGASFLGPVKEIVSNAVTFDQIRVTDLADPDTLYDQSISINGTVSGTPAAPFLAVAFSSAQPASGVHRAMKRFGQLSEDEMTTDGAVAGIMNDDLDDVKDVLNAGIDTDDDGLFVSHWDFVLVKRIKVTGPPVSYHLPEPEDFPAVAYITHGWQWSPKISSQNTRKFGRGE